jgi:hypothetical protein
VEKVNFDVAITVTEGEEKEGRAGLRVYGIGAGVGSKGSKGSETVSRIQFCVPLVAPTTPVKLDRTEANKCAMATAPRFYTGSDRI